MQMFKKMIAVFLSVVLIASSAILGVAAEDKGAVIKISTSIQTDKSSYGVMDTATVNVNVVNSSSIEIKDVSISVLSNDHMLVQNSGDTSVKVDKLAPGEGKALSFKMIMSSNSGKVNFIQKILLFFKKLFTKTTDFKNAEYNDGRSCKINVKEISFGGASTELTLKVWYSSDVKVIETEDITNFASALSDLVNEEMSDGNFSVEDALDNEYYSRRIIVKSENFDCTGYEPNAVISGPDDIFIVQFDTVGEAVAFQTTQEELHGVEYAEPDVYLQVDPTESESSSIASGNFKSWGVEYIGADDYAKYIVDSGLNREVTVAVVDTGVDLDNTYLSGRITNNGYDFVDNDGYADDEHYHGTHVAGTVVDCTPNLKVKIMPVRVLDENGSGYSSAVASGIKYAAANGANVINLSLGGRHSSYKDDAISYAISKGVTVCTAAGNDNVNTKNTCPAHITEPGNITVAAIDSSSQKAYFSNYGNAVDVAAPGVSIYSSIPNNKFKSLNGTSMATPHVAAVAAMFKQVNPSSTPAQIENLVKTYTNDLGSLGFDIYYGNGAPNLNKAIPEVEKYTVTFVPDEGIETEAFEDAFTPGVAVSIIAFISDGYTWDSWAVEGVDNYSESVTTDSDVPNQASITFIMPENDVVIMANTVKGRTVVDKGVLGENDNVSWTLYDDGELVISGQGDMTNSLGYYDPSDDYPYMYSNGSSPWNSLDLNEQIKQVTISDGITNIGKNAFMNCENLEKIIIPNSVLKIEDQAFHSCKSLKHVYMSENLESIGMGAFEMCESLDSIWVPESLTYLGEYAFRGCTSLEYVLGIGFTKITSIEERTFAACVKLGSIVLPKTVERIGVAAFKSCESLESIEIGFGGDSKLTQIEDSAFQWCFSLKTVLYSLSKESWAAILIGANNEALLSAEIDCMQGSDIPVVQIPDEQ